MWQTIHSYMPSGLTWICAMLSWLIPYGMYRINKKLHQLGDPPWKKEDTCGNE